jgi:hypothetical protein
MSETAAMSNETWQLIAALAVVAVAASILVRRIYRFVSGKTSGACGTGQCGSGGCGDAVSYNASSGIVERPLVQLGSLNSSKHDRT